MNMDETKM